MSRRTKKETDSIFHWCVASFNKIRSLIVRFCLHKIFPFHYVIGAAFCYVYVDNFFRHSTEKLIYFYRIHWAKKKKRKRNIYRTRCSWKIIDLEHLLKNAWKCLHKLIRIFFSHWNSHNYSVFISRFLSIFKHFQLNYTFDGQLPPNWTFVVVFFSLSHT